MCVSIYIYKTMKNRWVMDEKIQNLRRGKLSLSLSFTDLITLDNDYK